MDLVDVVPAIHTRARIYVTLTSFMASLRSPGLVVDAKWFILFNPFSLMPIKKMRGDDNGPCQAQAAQHTLPHTVPHAHSSILYARYDILNFGIGFRAFELSVMAPTSAHRHHPGTPNTITSHHKWSQRRWPPSICLFSYHHIRVCKTVTKHHWHHHRSFLSRPARLPPPFS